MKTIGLLGGTSWPSTFSYYDRLNRLAQQKLGGYHSARLVLYSIDYHPIKSLYGEPDGWDVIPSLLAKEISLLLAKEPDCLILCNNTLHRALDVIRDSLNITVPVFHAGHLAAEEAARRECKTVLLLGTRFTMEDGFFARYFQMRGMDVIIPEEADRQLIQIIQSEVAQGKQDPSYRATLGAMLRRYNHVDSIILACTELPLVINESNVPKPLINPIHCQCDAAADFAFIRTDSEAVRA